jgi:hypothetical protein
MKIRLFIMFSVLGPSSALAQISRDILQINNVVAGIDSTIVIRKEIGVYIVPKFSDYGDEVFLEHSYTIDTVKGLLHKVVYNFVHFEEVSFYYNELKIIKAVVIDTSRGKNYSCEYYFKNDWIISKNEHGLAHPKTSWDRNRINAQARQYMIDFLKISDLHNKWKKQPVKNRIE